MFYRLFIICAGMFALIDYAQASDQTVPTKKLVYDAMLTKFEYPFTVKTFSLRSQRQDLTMAYMDVNPTAKKVVVLMHGKNFSGYYWERIARELKSKGYRVIIPDQIGFGKSSKPEHYQYSFYNLALNSAKLLDFLEISSFAVVGHSMGGMLATHFTYLYPKKVQKLVLLNPIGLEPYLQYAKFKDPDFFYSMEKIKTPEKMRAYQKKNYYDGKWRPAYEKLLEPHIGQMQGPDWERVAWNNALTYGPIFSEDITSKFSKIKTPTFLIIGTRDRTGPGRHWKKDGVKHQLGRYDQLGKAAAKAIKNAKLYELPGLGHMPQFEDYEKFLKAFSQVFQPSLK